eukprot:TRINITY_DN2018_c0_g1_i4.p1 TRINITY_DN2018_c0_g1~~TRINITY_DN2018_c0_g1_i4.p1  ORF type:complete len:785 (+),score=164.75 TRINITY_DN2018_c0_g1_i4:147-2357(+)
MKSRASESINVRLARAVVASCRVRRYWREQKLRAGAGAGAFAQLRESVLETACAPERGVAGAYGLRVCELGEPRYAHVAAPTPDALDAADAFLPCVRRRTSPVYMRDNNAEAKSLFAGVLARVAGGHQRKLRYELDAMLTNSPAVLRKLETLLPQHAARLRQALEEAGAAPILVCAPTPAPGVWLLRPDSDAPFAEGEAWQLLLEAALNRLGGMPSLYALRRGADPPAGPTSAAAVIPSPKDIFSSPLECPRLCVRRRTNPGAYVLWQAALKLAHVAASRGLLHDCQRAVVENAVDGIAAFQDSAAHVARFFEVLADELAVGTALTHPFTADQLHDAWRSTFTNRYPASAPLLHAAYFFSTGMDAITSSMHACGGPPVSLAPERDYCELVALCDARQFPDRRMLFYLTPNPSFPCEQPFHLDAVLQRLRDALGEDPQAPVVLLVDATVETGMQEKDSLWKLLAAVTPLVLAADGRLSLLLAKSFVKYATLGTGKAMAGGVLLLRHPQPQKERPFLDELATCLAELERELNWAASDDAQFLGLVFAACPHAELAIIDNACDNASYFARECWPGVVHTPGLPFVSIPRQLGRWSLRGHLITTLEVAALAGMEDRDSFSSLCTSVLRLPDIVRINVGQESRRELLHRFSCLGPLLGRPEQHRFPPELTRNTALEAVARLKQQLQGAPTVEASQEAELRVRSLDDFIARVFSTQAPAVAVGPSIRERLAQTGNGGQCGVC